MIPGVMSKASVWRHVAGALTGWQTVAVVNRRGRHPSGPLGPGYSLGTEVADAAAVLAGFGDVRTLFGWSYGGLIALRLASTHPLPHVIAYEPVIRPFAAHALDDLRRASEADDPDATVEIVMRQVSGMDAAAVERLRMDDAAWQALRRLGVPVYQETLAIDQAEAGPGLARAAGRVDLVVGGLDRGLPPYGTSFDDVCRAVPGAAVHELPGQGHMAHLEAPRELAALVDRLGGPAASG
nr:alpha/beta hydrolase [Auraticoccus cholistanensis]